MLELTQLLDHTKEMVQVQSRAVQALTDNAVALQAVKDGCSSCQKRCAECQAKQNETLLRMIWVLIVVIMVFAGINVAEIADLF